MKQKSCFALASAALLLQSSAFAQMPSTPPGQPLNTAREIQSSPRAGNVGTLTQQHLPAGGIQRSRAVNSLRDAADLPDTATVTINGKTANLGDLRRGVVVQGSIAKGSGMVIRHESNVTDTVANAAAAAEAIKGAPIVRPVRMTVRHELPKERWKLVRCGNVNRDSRSNNHCDGSDEKSAHNDADCVQRTLAHGVMGGVGALYCGYIQGSRAGGFHTKYSASNQEKISGVDVWEIQINPACSFEHGWASSYNTVTVEHAVVQPGKISATARWSTDRCISAKATFFGATIDEDYACFSSYHNTHATAKCPAGINP